MRKCIRCETEMIEDYEIKVEGAPYGIKLATGQGLFAERIGKPKAAGCPH